MNWIDAVSQMQRQNQAFVLVSVLEVQGSAPRGQLSKMVITKDQIFDSIGGGNLEFQAMTKARELLLSNYAEMEMEEYTLGEDLTQCCGGRVTLLFECFPSCDFQVVLCGAGHVGRALTKILAELPCKVNWLDERAELLLDTYSQLGSPSNVTPCVVDNPHSAIEGSPPSSLYLVMTHSHESDFEFCEAILSRNDVGICGLIGSRSKSAKFRSRLQKKGFSETELEKFTCPIGLDIGAGKQPMEVAVAVVAQLMLHASMMRKRNRVEAELPLTVVPNS